MCLSSCLAVLIFTASGGWADPGQERRHKHAQTLYSKGQFRKAAEVIGKELSALEADRRGGPLERELREMLSLSLYNSQQLNEAVAAYAQLLERFPDFRFDPDRVLPDTIAFFDEAAPRPPDVTPQPGSMAAPRAIAVAPSPPTAPRWQWHYLIPFGVGQYTAGSPVRGTVFLVAQLGFVATNLAGLATYRGSLRPDGFASNAARARTGQLIMNIGFFGAIAAFAAGVVDGVFFE